MRTRNKPHTHDSLIERTQVEGDCFIWQGALTTNGYGAVNRNGKRTTAHRLMYELTMGAIPEGVEIDHTCNDRRCINPDHLQAVSHQKNMELGASRRKTCKRGHEWNQDTTYVASVKRKQGGVRLQRYCRVCRAEYQAKRRSTTTPT